MITKVTSEEDIREAVDYIGESFKTTPYLYVNLIKYGLGTDNVQTWIDKNNDNSIEGLYLLYYDCIHFFTNDVQGYPIERLVDFVKSTRHKVLMFQGQIGDRVEDMFTTYYSERNHVIDMDKVGLDNKNYLSKQAREQDIPQIVDLLMADPEYTNVYEREVLSNQLYDRFHGNFSRFFIVKLDDKVVATCSTYGEVPGFALVGGVVVHPEYRKRGLASDVENYACHVLEKEGISRVGFVNVNNTASLHLHKKLGAYSVSILAKYIKK